MNPNTNEGKIRRADKVTQKRLRDCLHGSRAEPIAVSGKLNVFSSKGPSWGDAVNPDLIRLVRVHQCLTIDTMAHSRKIPAQSSPSAVRVLMDSISASS